MVGKGTGELAGTSFGACAVLVGCIVEREVATAGAPPLCNVSIHPVHHNLWAR
jgi:hypothetical protein